MTLAIVVFMLAVVLGAAAPTGVFGSATSPRLWLIAGAYGANFAGISGSGAHVLIESGYEPVTGESGAYLLYDTIGARYTPTATGSSTVILDRMAHDGSAYTFIPSHRLVDEDTDEYPDLYLHADGENILLDPSLDWLGGGASYVASGGEFVIVRTSGAFDPADVDGQPDDYIWERSTGDLRLIAGPPDQSFTAVSPDDSTIFLQDPFGATSTWVDGVVTPITTGTIQWISATGDRIFISTEASLVAEDTDGWWDAYEVGPGGNRLLSSAFAVPIWMSDRHVSSTGDRWILSSTYPIGPADTDNSRNDNVLVTTEGAIHVLPGGEEHAYVVAASHDLSALVIQTASQLTLGDVDQGTDLYRWSIHAPSVVTLLTSGTDSAVASLQSMSADGRRIVFVTKEPLIAESGVEAAAYDDIYESFDGTLTSVTPNTSKAVAFRGASDDGQRVVFSTAEALIAEDGDTTSDLYVSDRDVTAPIATIDTAPGIASGGTITVELGTEDGDGVFFECRVDSSAFAPCDATATFVGTADGYHVIGVRAFDAAANRSSEAVAAVAVGVAPDTNPPIGAVSISDGADYADSPSVMVLTAAADDETGVAQVALSNDGVTWTTRTYVPSQSWTLPSTNGTKRVYAKWQDVAGNWTAVKSDTIVLDTVAPTASKPGRAFLKGKALSAGAITTRINWTGSDATSGIARYELHQQTDGGSWTAVSTSLTNVLTNRSLASEHDYRFRVRAVDKAGNVGAWAYGDTFRVSRLSETNGRISYSGTWSTSKASVFWGGQAKASSRAGSRATLTFTGRSVAWVASMGPTRGKADVYVNGSKVATVDLYSATSKHQQVVWAGSWTTSASRTISIRVQGTGGRPRVDLDGLVTAN